MSRLIQISTGRGGCGNKVYINSGKLGENRGYGEERYEHKSINIDETETEYNQSISPGVMGQLQEQDRAGQEPCQCRYVYLYVPVCKTLLYQVNSGMQVRDCIVCTVLYCIILYSPLSL